MNYSDDFREMIKMYNEELKKAQQKSKPVNAIADNVQNTPDNTQKTLDDTQKTPVDFTNIYNLPSIPDDQVIKGQTDNLTGEGYLTVRLATSNLAAPISGGIVLVSFDGESGETLIKSLITNVNGETERIALPTVSSSESLQPGVDNPYAAYSIRASKDGFFTIDSVNVPIFDKQVAVQTVEMIPLPEGYNGKTVLKSNDTGSITLG